MRQVRLEESTEPVRMTRRHNVRRVDGLEHELGIGLHALQSVTVDGLVPVVQAGVHLMLVNQLGVGGIHPRRNERTLGGTDRQRIGIEADFLQLREDQDIVLRDALVQPILQANHDGGHGTSQVGGCQLGLLVRCPRQDLEQFCLLGRGVFGVGIAQVGLHILRLLLPFLGQRGIEEPALAGLAGDEEVPFQEGCLEQTGNESHDEFGHRTLALVERVVPCGLSVTEEDDGFLLHTVIIAFVLVFVFVVVVIASSVIVICGGLGGLLKSQCRIHRRLLPLLVLAECQELERRDEQPDLLMRRRDVHQQAQRRSQQEGPKEAGNQPGPVEGHHGWQGEQRPNDSHVGVSVYICEYV
mmetsp:Transcript_16599/g.46403  ORF Transcript_16599/g.46403 Transcript_16599/m.46403 type:complete len:355 (+) Transcript_16599:1667-2731(+)